MKLPELPPVAIGVHVPPPDELELLDEDEDDELELDEVLPDEELELLEDELELLDEELFEPPLIVPAEAVNVTRSSLAPSSRRRIRSVWEPAARPLKVMGVMLA